MGLLGTSLTGWEQDVVTRMILRDNRVALSIQGTGLRYIFERFFTALIAGYAGILTRNKNACKRRSSDTLTWTEIKKP